MALVEQESTPIASVQVRGSGESRGSLRDWLARARSSVWAPILLRALGITLGMLGLATIGALATARGAPGYTVAAPERAQKSLGSGAADPSKEHQGVPAPRVEASLAAGTRARRGSAKSAPSTAPSEPQRSPALTEDGRVILNLATVDDLRHLPGIGRKRAESILELRDKLGGRFRRLSDLLRIRGIGARRLKQLTPLVLLDPPPAEPASVASGSSTPPPAPAPRAD